MITFPNCKINVGLNILSKREDGYHNIESVFVPIIFHDILEIIPTSTTSAVQLNITGKTIEGNLADNIISKAYWLLKELFPEKVSGVDIYLHKRLPTGAGLGGGSANGTFTLMMLNEIFNLNIDKKTMVELSLQLGSDCPFFVYNQPCFAEGRGEKLMPITIDLSAYRWVLIHPNFHISTKNIFQKIALQKPAINLLETIQQPIETWKEQIVNDFETVVFTEYPKLKAIKETLYSFGAKYASMTGTGSSIYGIFDKKIALSKPFFSKNYTEIISEFN